MAPVSIPKHRILAISLHTRQNRRYSPGVNWRVGVSALALVGALALGGGVPPARAAGTPTLTVEVIGQGTVTGTGINCGLGNLSCYSAYGTDPQPVTLTAATSASGWSFDHWADDAAGCGTTNPCSIAGGVTGAKTATAVFKFSGAVQASTLAVSTANGGVVDGSPAYPINCDPSPTTGATNVCSLTTYTGSTLTVTEAPDAGYLFDGWGGACSGTGPSCAVYLQSDASVSAGFVSNTSKTLTVTEVGNGSVSGGGISCGAGATCSAPEPSNSTVTLTATPLSGWVLTGWSGGCTGTQATCTVQMTSASTVTATFAQLATLSVAVSGSGYVSGGGIGCDGGQTCTATETPNTIVTLTAHPSSGGTVFWSGCTSTAGTLCTVTIGTGVQSVTATLSGGTAPPVATNSLAISVQGDGYVVGALGAAGIHCTAAGGSGCSASVTANTTVTLSAIPASGNSADFTRWTGDCSAFTSTSCTLTMNGSKSVGAVFAGGNTTYTLSGQVTGSGTISGGGLTCTSAGGGGCNAPQAAGATITLIATSSFGSTFGGWGGACTGTTASCAVAMTSAKSVTATFTSAGSGTTESVALTVAGAGSVTGTGVACASTSGRKLCTLELTRGESVTLTAKPAKGSVLFGWTGACSGRKPTCKLTVNAPTTVGVAFVRPALASTHVPRVRKVGSRYRLTLYYHSLAAGTLRATAKRSGTTVAARSAKAKAGTHTLALTLPGKGRYVVTLSVRSTTGTHAIRWRLTIE